MDTHNFVLLTAAFMVIATLMVAVSHWHYVPTPKFVPHFACRLDQLCRGTDCSAPLPPDMLIVPQADGDAAYLTDDLELGTRTALDTVAPREWVGRSGDAGMVRLRILDGGAFALTETAGFAPDSAILTTGFGQCRDVTIQAEEQG